MGNLQPHEESSHSEGKGRTLLPFWVTASIALGGFAFGTLAHLFFVTRGADFHAPDFVLFVGRFHPLVVHLPIGILLFATMLEAASLSKRHAGWADGATWPVLFVLVLSSVGAIVLGHMLASGGGYPERLISLHRTLVLVALFFASAALVLWSWMLLHPSRALRLLYRALLGFTMLTLTTGAHHGGSMTRGEAYLGKYAPGPLKPLLGASAAKAEGGITEVGKGDPKVFEHVVLPVLREHCTECHGEEAKKGGLRLDSLDEIRKGGASGAVLVPGDSGKSLLVSRMLLPLGNDERMPPKGRPAPEAGAIALLSFWIDAGANGEQRVRDVLVPMEARALLEKMSQEKVTTPPATNPPEADAGALASASDAGAVRTTLAFRDLVLPVLVARCGKCHGAEKQKGRLRVDSVASLLRGGKGGPAVIENQSSRSSLVTRVRLPLTNDEHMPPSAEPQMTPAELSLVAWWIDHGAREDLAKSEVPARLQAVRAVRAPKADVDAGAERPRGANAGDAGASPVGQRTIPASVNLLHEVVLPTMDRLCTSCHSAETTSGGLRLDSEAALLRGGKHGAVIAPGDPDKSTLLKRMHLPIKDDEHMPPEGLTQPTKDELLVLRYWIATGAGSRTESVPNELASAVAAMYVPRASEPEDAGKDAGEASGEASGETLDAARVEVAPPRTHPRPSGCASCLVGYRGSPSVWVLVIPILGALRRRIHPCSNPEDHALNASLRAR